MYSEQLAPSLSQAKTFLSVGVLFVLWLFETWIPFFHDGRGRSARLRHAGRNLTITGFNIALVALAFAAATGFVANWAAMNRVGLLRLWNLPPPLEAALAILLMDAWMYLWHRLNHVTPFLWRFHRMHHSDPLMDVTSATRFHPGEIVISTLLRLAIVPLLGMSLWHLVLYEALLLPVIQFHHSNVRLPASLDRAFRTLLVSPNMHRVHHSRFRPETDSNYASVLSFWDRIAGTFRLREDPATIELGLVGYDDPRWQTVVGMLRTPLRDRTPDSSAEYADVDHTKAGI